MNTRSLHILLPLLLFALSLTGCNSDIFIDDDPPSAKQLEIALGEEKGVKFQTENLRGISVSFTRLTFDVTTYTPPDEKFREYRNLSTVHFYDIQSTLPFISRISAVENYYDIELEMYRKSDGEVSIKAVKNGSGEAIHGTINLVYSYKTEKIDFTIGYEKDEAVYYIAGLTYDPTSIEHQFASTKSSSLTLRNLGDKPSHQTFKPEGNCHTIVQFKVHNIDNFNIDTEASSDIPLRFPTIVFDGQTPLIGLNGETTFYSNEPIVLAPLDSALPPDGKSFFTDYPVEVPPMSAMQGVFKLETVLIQAEAELNLSDKASGKSRHLRTEVFVTQPFYYTFHWQEIPLDEK